MIQLLTRRVECELHRGTYYDLTSGETCPKCDSYAWGATFVPLAPVSVSASDPVALTPEVKEAIAQDVKAQLAEEQAAAGPAPQAQSVSDEVPPHLIPRGVRLLYRRTWP
jgi:hypothetical protein